MPIYERTPQCFSHPKNKSLTNRQKTIAKHMIPLYLNGQTSHSLIVWSKNDNRAPPITWGSTRLPKCRLIPHPCFTYLFIYLQHRRKNCLMKQELHWMGIVRRKRLASSQLQRSFQRGDWRKSWRRHSQPLNDYAEKNAS